MWHDILGNGILGTILGNSGGSTEYPSQINIHYSNLPPPQETLSMCQHGSPLKLGCPECPNILEGECEVLEIDGKKLIK